MINIIHLFTLIFLIKTVSSFSVPEDEFNVYGHVPGLEQSQFYRLRLRKYGSEDWHEPFTFVTECTAAKFCNTTRVYNHLRDWSNSYINFEMIDGVNIEIEISKLWGDDPINKAVVHPKTAANNCEVRDGKAYLMISKPGLFAIDINGQMDDQDTGRLPGSLGNHSISYYKGPPIHTVTVFANPFLPYKPSLVDPGVHGLKRNAYMEDMFVRAADDSSYVGGRGMKRVVLWNDSNGSSFVMSHIGSESINSHPVIVEDCTVIYSRSHFAAGYFGGGVFNMRGNGQGTGGYTVSFRNIVVEDPRPTMASFKIQMEHWRYPEKHSRRGPGDLFGVVFQNISIAAHSVLDPEIEPEILWGMDEARIMDFVFENVSIGNDTVESMEYFSHNEYVIET